MYQKHIFLIFEYKQQYNIHHVILDSSSCQMTKLFDINLNFSTKIRNISFVFETLPIGLP